MKLYLEEVALCLTCSNECLVHLIRASITFILKNENISTQSL